MSLTPPVFCLVTDRRRLAARLGIPLDAAVDALLAQVTAAAQAGVGLIQVREADLPARTLVALVRAIHAAVAPHGSKVVVNDRLDIALAGGADGVHLKVSSIPVAEALRLTPPGWLVGRSAHTVEEVTASTAAGADYLIVGSIFPTRSKPAGWHTMGLDGLETAVRAAAHRPVLAIGGIGCAQAALVARTGAAGVAAIGAFLPPDATRIDDTVQERARQLRIAFDSSSTPSLT